MSSRLLFGSGLLMVLGAFAWPQMGSQDDALGRSWIEEHGAPAFEVAVTVDDLPWSGPAPGGEQLSTSHRRILEALEERAVPAVGFVVCDGLRDVRVLQAWIDAGHELGNHTAAHDGLNSTDPAIWLAGVERCDRFLRELTEPVYFRYPMLHRGSTAELRDRMADAVRRLGYRLAQVTVDNSEWVIATQYREAAARRDSAVMYSLGVTYVDHVRRATRHARTIARARFGRDVRHVPRDQRFVLARGSRVSLFDPSLRWRR